MADEKTQQSILKITLDNKEAIKAIGDYQEEIGKCSKAINSLKETQKMLDQSYKDGNISKEEYREQSRKVTDAINTEQAAQSALKKQMSQVQYQMQKNIQQNVEANGSLKSLRGQLSQLNAQYDSLSREERENIGVGGKLQRQIEDLTAEITAAEEATGRYQRNVGHYQNAFKGMGQSVNTFKNALGVAQGGINGFKGGLDALSTSPALAIFGIVVGILGKLWQKLKENESAMAAIKKALNLLKPVMDFMGGIIETLAEWLGIVIEKVTSFLGNSGLFQKITSAVIGVGNVIFQHMIAPFKGVIAAIKVFQEEGIKGIGNAAKAFGGAIKDGFSVVDNFKSGQEAGDKFIQGMISKKPKAKEAGKEVGKDAADGLAEGLAEGFKKIESALNSQEKEAEKWIKNIANHLEYLADKVVDDVMTTVETDIDKGMEEANSLVSDYTSQLFNDQETQRRAGLNGWEKYFEDYNKFLDENGDKIKTWNSLQQTSFNGVSSLLGSLADAYESNTDATKEELEKVKKLRIAGAIINMLSGVATAVSTAMELGPIMGPIMGSINSATVIASSMAQINKMKATQFANGGYVSGPGTGTSDSINARLSNGESVMTARATSMFAPLLSQLNQVAGGNAIVPPSGADTEVLEQAIARGMASARLSVSVTEIDTVRQRMDLIESNANV